MQQDILDIVDSILDQEGPVRIGGLTFDRSAIVREMDPVAYSELVADIVDDMITDLTKDIDCLDPDTDADEIEELRERLEDLENFSY